MKAIINLVACMIVTIVLSCSVMASLFESDSNFVILRQNSSCGNGSGNVTGYGTNTYLPVWSSDTNLVNTNIAVTEFGSYTYLDFSPYGLWFNTGTGPSPQNIIFQYIDDIMMTPNYWQFNQTGLHLDGLGNCLYFNDGTNQCTAASGTSGGNASISEFSTANRLAKITNGSTLVPSLIQADDNDAIKIYDNASNLIWRIVTNNSNGDLAKFDNYNTGIIYRTNSTSGMAIYYYNYSNFVNNRLIAISTTTGSTEVPWVVDGSNLDKVNNKMYVLVRAGNTTTGIDAAYMAAKSTTIKYVWGNRAIDDTWILSNPNFAIANTVANFSSTQVKNGLLIEANNSLIQFHADASYFNNQTTVEKLNITVGMNLTYLVNGTSANRTLCVDLDDGKVFAYDGACPA